MFEEIQLAKSWLTSSVVDERPLHSLGWRCRTIGYCVTESVAEDNVIICCLEYCKKNYFFLKLLDIGLLYVHINLICKTKALYNITKLVKKPLMHFLHKIQLIIKK